MKIIRVLDHSFLPQFLKTADIALDCGSNCGEFAKWLSENTPAQIHAFEPDPNLFDKLPVLPRVTYYPKAIDGESGEMELAIGVSACSSAVYREEHRRQELIRVPKTSLDDFCSARGIEKIDLIKIDIEGAELSLLEKTSDKLLRNTKQITVEFHDFLCKNDVPRIKGIWGRFSDLGFYCIRFSHFTWGDCLFVNTAYIKLGCFRRFALNLRGKYLPGALRYLDGIMKTKQISSKL